MNPHNLPDVRDFRAHTDIQIRFNDVDILGHVNNTVYFSFYDTGKALYLMEAGQGEMNPRRVECVIANIDCAFISSIFFGQEIEVRTRCVAISEKSFRLQQILVEKETDRICSIAETVMVTIDPDKHTVVPVSDKWRRFISEYEGREF